MRHYINLSWIKLAGVTTDPVDTIGVETNDASLSCSASGAPTIKWEKAGGGSVPSGASVTSDSASVTSQLSFTDIKV